MANDCENCDASWKADSFFQNVSLTRKFIPVFALDDGARDRVLKLYDLRPRIVGYLDIR